MYLKIIIFILIYLIGLSSQYGKKSEIIFKKLSPIEIHENIPIGFTLIDLKSNIIDQNEINYLDSHFSFIFIENDKYSDVLNTFSLKNYFLLDEISGTIKTSKSIDLEYFCDSNICQNRQNDLFNESSKEGCLIHFKILATRIFHNDLKSQNKKQMYHISFDLIIDDINEFYPEFNQQGPLNFNINEEFSPIKLLIGTVPYDNDCTDRSQIFYLIKVVDIIYTSNAIKFKPENNLDFNFQVIIEQELLFLYTDRSFDREIYQRLELDLVAFDRKDFNHTNESQLKIYININDINDNAPKFERSVYNLEFDEGLLPGTELIRLKAIDPDQGQNGLVRYEFSLNSINQEIKETFLLNRTTGELILKQKLNPGIKKWTLQIRASDNGLQSKWSTCMVIITVNDVNNNKPEILLNLFVIPKLIEPKFLTTRNFDKKTTHKEEIIYLSKHIEVNTTIGIVNVIDRDSGSNGQIDGCEFVLLDLENKKIPVYLQSFNDVDLSSENYSIDPDLNNDIKSLVEIELKSYKKLKNEQKYFIRTKINFQNASKFNLEIRASDKGNINRQTGIKSFKIVVFNSNTNVYDTDEDVPVNNFYSDDEEFDDLDEETNQYKTSRLVLRVDLNENNQTPIDLVQINPSDFDLKMGLFKYELILPSFIYQSDFNSTYFKNKALISKCSVDLIKHLDIDGLTGVIKLNKTLDRELCPSYKFFIRATNLQEQRIFELLTFKINVLDLDDNGPKFEQSHYIFEIIENFNKTLNIGVIDPDLKTNYLFRIEGLTDEEKIENLNEIFKLEQGDSKSVNIIMKQNFEFKIRNRYLFNLIVIEVNEFDHGIVNMDSTLIEIIILNEKDLRPSIKKLEILGDLKVKNLSFCKRLNNQIFYVQTSLDHLIKKLKIIEPFKSRAYLHILQVQVENDRLINHKSEIIRFFIDGLEFYEGLDNFKNKTKFVFPPSIDSNEFFFIAESDGILNIEMTNFNQLNSKIKAPFICVLGIKAKNITNQLTTNFSVILSLYNEKTFQNELTKLDSHLYEKYSIHHKFTTKKANLTGSFMFRENFKTFRNVIANSHLPLLVLTVIIIFLLVILIILFIISILYSLTICKIFECSNKKSYDAEIKVNDTCQNALISQDILDAQKTHGWLRFKISNLFNAENKQKLGCPNICLNTLENAKNSKFVQKTDKSDYLLDSPILVRKIYETTDSETKEKYLKKYHLEYLFENTNAKQIEMIEPDEKKTKRISFKCNRAESQESNNDNKLKNSPSSYEDDDYIIPTKNVYKFNGQNQENLNFSLFNQMSSSYSKSNNQPDDIVWIKKLNSKQKANSGLTFKNKEIVL